MKPKELLGGWGISAVYNRVRVPSTLDVINHREMGGKGLYAGK